MKKVILIFSIILASLGSQAQNKSTVGKTKSTVSKKTFPVKGTLVTVNDWSEIGNWYIAKFWSSNKAAIVSQIGSEEFEAVTQNGDENAWPNVFRERVDENDNDISAEKFKDLKLYKIATFSNIINGENFGDMVILRVSRNENDTIFLDTDWFGDIYFVLKASSITDK